LSTVENRIISPKRATEMTSLSFRQIVRLENADRFPQRVLLSDRRFGYAEGEVLTWISARLSARVPRRRINA
jgi:predicted DNA-binding transcriptional regulator AlpA